jgi:hypothetical protein
MGGKRLDAHGNRTCKHTRMVDAGIADQQARRHLDYGQTTQTVSHKTAAAPKKVVKTRMESVPARKIEW